MPVHHFNRDSLPATPWKNGGGITREIVCQPPGAGMDAFDWRVSIAHIASDGPFSAFAGVDRVITLLEGAGVQLSSPDGQVQHRLDTPLLPFAFAGEAPVVGQLRGGDCHDFNVMTRRARCHASVTVCRTSGDVPPAPHGLLMAVSGEWQVRGDSHGPHALHPGQGLWWNDETISWRLGCKAAGAALLCVCIHPVNP